MIGLLSATDAAAEDARKKLFVDWEYAVQAWQSLPTGAEFDREYDRVVPAYEAWKRRHGKPDVAALAALTGEDADVIRQGHDLQRVYALWLEIYRAWYSGRGVTREPDGWNETTKDVTCLAISGNNIFTGECNDLPDWRTDEDVARDDRVLADFLAKQAKKAATN